MHEILDRAVRPARPAAPWLLPISHVALLVVLATGASLATAQTTLGELLDAGATIMKVEDFQQEVVSRLLFGKSPSGGDLEIVYGASGTVEGAGSPPRTANWIVQKVMISGRWSADKDGRICTILRFGQLSGGSSDTLPPRCQYWFKLGDAYFVSDYDSDRSAKVLRRTLKEPSASGALSAGAPKTLGDLLDAGATKLSKQQVLDTINGARVSGARPDGATSQAVYKTDGTYLGSYQGGLGAQSIGKVGGLFGKWTVADDGKLCDEHGIFAGKAMGQWPLPASGAGTAMSDTNCGFVFTLHDEYYVCASDLDRSAPAYRRVVKR